MSKKQMRMLYDLVLVELLEEEESSTPILLPDSAKKTPNEGIVLAVGPGLRNASGTYDPLHVKVGDRVMFEKWSGIRIKFNDKDCVVLKESDKIFSVVEIIKEDK